LLQIANRTPPAEVNVLLIMPTWRADLVDAQLAAASLTERVAAFAASDYARHWCGVLRSDRLRNLAAQHGQRMVFMPHPNALPYLDAFDFPDYVEVAANANTSMQHMFARSAGFVTDYTSVAFEMAFLRRPVFYYQFDRDRFYSGGHNWRPGYFDYERDGFGPVAETEKDLLDQLQQYFSNQCQVQPQYLARMQRAMPYQDDLACQRVYEKLAGWH
jgi:CDP-glycerol glycerophosphotransferase (TagB/SpsB family)